MALASGSITPLSAAVRAASAATATRAGSATVVPKPRVKENSRSQNRLPLRAKSCARPSPRGNRPISRPLTNSARPNMTNTRPINISTRLGNGCCRTASWNTAMTAMIGTRSRSVPRTRNTNEKTDAVRERRRSAPAKRDRVGFGLSPELAVSLKGSGTLTPATLFSLHSASSYRPAAAQRLRRLTAFGSMPSVISRLEHRGKRHGGGGQ